MNSRKLAEILAKNSQKEQKRDNIFQMFSSGLVHRAHS